MALVTGAARGLGRAFSRGLAAEGAHVVLVDIDEAGLEALAATLSSAGADVARVRADVTAPADVDRLFEDVQRLGRLDVLVNNAGRFPSVPLEEMTLGQWRAVLSVNLESVFLCTKAAIPLMKRNGYGRIINVASTSIYHGTAGLAHYVAAKAGVVGLTRSAASELGRYGITVNAIAPGLTLTEGMRADPRFVAAAESRIAARAIARHALPEDLVPTLLFLASPEADFISGQTLSVNGGEVKL